MGDKFTFRGVCRAGGAHNTAFGRMIVSSNLPDNGWTGARHSGSNIKWADCTSGTWTELSGEHTVTHGAGVRVGFRIDNRGGSTILWDSGTQSADETLSEEECRTAAALHGLVCSNLSSSDRPKGCHYSPEDISSPAFFILRLARWHGVLLHDERRRLPGGVQGRHCVPAGRLIEIAPHTATKVSKGSPPFYLGLG